MFNIYKEKFMLLVAFVLIIIAVVYIVYISTTNENNTNIKANIPPEKLISDNSLKQIGLCYSYDKTKYYGNSCTDFEKLINIDFAKIKAAGYNDIKTYWGYFGGEYGCLCDPIKGGMFVKVANDNDLKIVIGLDPNSYPKDQWGFDVKKCILDSISRYPSTIKGIIIGNENVNGNLSIAKKIVDVYNDLKKSTNIPIGTAQQNGYWICMNGTKNFCNCNGNSNNNNSNTDCQ